MFFDVLSYSISAPGMSTLHNPVCEPEVAAKVKKKRKKKKKFKNVNELIDNFGSSFEKFKALRDNEQHLEYEEAIICIPPMLHDKVKPFLDAKQKPYTLSGHFSSEMTEDIDLSFTEHDPYHHGVISSKELSNAVEFDGESHHLESSIARLENEPMNSKVTQRMKKTEEDRECNQRKHLEYRSRQQEIKEELLKISLKPYLAVCVRNGMVRMYSVTLICLFEHCLINDS